MSNLKQSNQELILIIKVVNKKLLNKTIKEIKQWFWFLTVHIKIKVCLNNSNSFWERKNLQLNVISYQNQFLLFLLNYWCFQQQKFFNKGIVYLEFE